MARAKRRGERGHPCLVPLSNPKNSEFSPGSLILVWGFWYKTLKPCMNSLQRPYSGSSSYRYNQLTLSKALWISRLRITAGFACKLVSCIIFVISLKLSVICLPGIPFVLGGLMRWWPPPLCPPANGQKFWGHYLWLILGNSYVVRCDLYGAWLINTHWLEAFLLGMYCFIKCNCIIWINDGPEYGKHLYNIR